MWARVSTIATSPERVEQAMTTISGQTVPPIKEMAGVQGALFLADRSGGKMIAITLWESEEAMRASEEAANAVRDEAAASAAGSIVSVERFEVFDRF